MSENKPEKFNGLFDEEAEMLISKRANQKKSNKSSDEKTPMYTCAGPCGKRKPEQYFLTNHGYLNQRTHKLPYCTDCINELFALKYKEFNDVSPGMVINISTIDPEGVELPLSYCCMVLDICCSKKGIDAFKRWILETKRKVEETPNSNPTSAFIGNYTRILMTTMKDSLAGYTYEYSDVQFLRNNDEIVSTDLSPEELSVLTFKWGTNYDPAEYIKLEEMYQKLSRYYEHDTPVMDGYLRTIAISHVQGEKCLSKGDYSGWEKSNKIFNSSCAAANINPNQARGNNAPEQNTFGMFIKKIEETKPIKEVDPELKDVDGIKKYLEIFFVGMMAKILGITNTRCYNMYAEVEKKYKSDIDNTEVDESSSVENDVFASESDEEGSEDDA